MSGFSDKKSKPNPELDGKKTEKAVEPKPEPKKKEKTEPA